MATDEDSEDDLISDGSDGKFHIRKWKVLHRFGRRSPELERVEW